MDLFEQYSEDEILGKTVNTNQNNNSNMIKIIIAAIAVIAVIIIAIIIIKMNVKSKEMRFYIDDQRMEIKEEYFDISEDKKNISISISEMAKLLGMEYFKGEYGKNSEDSKYGYIKNEEETVIFEANSKKIYKIKNNNENEKYSYLYLDENLKYSGNNLYTTTDGMRKIMNVIFTFDKDIKIRTLEYLNNYYTQYLGEFGYQKISDEYENQKAMLYDILIVQKDTGKYGVIKTDGTELVGAKYDEILYIENSGDLIVKSNGKYGIINSQGRSKIDISYDEITLMDEDKELYIVAQNGKYGVIDGKENIIVTIDKQEIGIDKSVFSDTEIKNPYLIYNNCIPVKKDDKWGIINRNAKTILPLEFDCIGSIIGTNTTNAMGNVVLIEDYEAIVVGKNGLYQIISSTGDTLVPLALTTVYSTVTDGVKKYIIEGVQGGQRFSYDFEDYADYKGYRKVNRNVSDETDPVSNINNTVNNTTSEENNDNDNDDSNENEDEENNENEEEQENEEENNEDEEENNEEENQEEQEENNEE